MIEVLPTLERGHIRVQATNGGEGVQLAVYGPQGGLLGGCAIEASAIQSLIGMLERVDQEAGDVFGRLRAEAERERWAELFTLVPDLGTH